MSPATNNMLALPPRATRRKWLGLAVIALPCMLYSMDLTVLNLALPALSKTLKPSASQLLWIVDIYGFMVAGFLITMGNLGDRIGRRRLLLIGAAAFGAASVLAAYAETAEMLIGLRALLGVAGATLAPSTLSLIRVLFENERERSFAISVWITSFSVGAAVGPVIGGVLLQYFWWGSVFLIGVPVMLLLLLVGPRLLPEYRDPHAARIDLASVVLSLAAVLPMIYGLKRLAEDGLAILPLLVMGLGLFTGWVFVRRQARLVTPLIDLTLFAGATFRAAFIGNAVACLVLFGIFVFIAQYLQLVVGLSALAAGLWTVPWALAFVIGSLATPVLARRFSAARMMVGGQFVAAIGLALLALAGVNSSPAVVVAAAVVLSLGLAPTFTLATDLIVSTAPPERAGSAAALSETGSEFGGALGIALFGSLGAWIYRNAMLGIQVPGLDPATLDAARSTLGAAVGAAAELSAASGDTLQATARIAFVHGLQFTAVLAAAITLGTAVFVARAFRRRGA